MIVRTKDTLILLPEDRVLLFSVSDANALTVLLVDTGTEIELVADVIGRAGRELALLRQALEEKRGCADLT